MNDLKTLRDKIAGYLPLAPGETIEGLITEWDEKHKALEALKENDERNYVGFSDD